jgi:hypothetical protein
VVAINKSARLTTDHPTSSYGAPVLVLEHQAYGPGDTLPSGEFAASYVGRWSLLPERTPEDLEAARSYLGQWGALVSSGDVAQIAGVEPNTVRQWERRYEDFPTPAARTAGGNIYWRVEVERWLRQTGRL